MDNLPMKIEEENSQIEPKILNFDSMSDGELYRNFNTIIKFVKAKEYSNIASSLNLLENFLFYSSRKSRFTREYEERKKLMISICKSLYLSENGACGEIKVIEKALESFQNGIQNIVDKDL